MSRDIRQSYLEREGKRAMNWFERKKIVVPIDFSDESRRVIDTALEMVFRPSDIYVVHVAPELGSMALEVVWEPLDDELRRQRIESTFLAEFAEEKYNHLNFHVCFGDPGQQIVEYAEKVGAGAVVMPSHGRSGLGRLLLGSVAERVLRLAKCPVLVLKAA